MNLNKLSKEELLKIKSDHYNMEQFIKYVNFLEKGVVNISQVIHKSNTDKNWYEVQNIVDKLMERI